MHPIEIFFFLNIFVNLIKLSQPLETQIGLHNSKLTNSSQIASEKIIVRNHITILFLLLLTFIIVVIFFIKSINYILKESWRNKATGTQS